MKKFKVLKLNNFCLFMGKTLGIAGDTFASQGWKISDEVFDSVRGQKFGWIAATTGGYYTDWRGDFTRPTEDQVQKLMTEFLFDKALDQKLIEVE